MGRGHNELRNFTAELLTEVYPNACIEPSLQPLTGQLLSHATANSEDSVCLKCARFFYQQGISSDQGTTKEQKKNLLGRFRGPQITEGLHFTS